MSKDAKKVDPGAETTRIVAQVPRVTTMDLTNTEIAGATPRLTVRPPGPPKK
jgi:hypothetical protein